MMKIEPKEQVMIVQHPVEHGGTARRWWGGYAAVRLITNAALVTALGAMPAVMTPTDFTKIGVTSVWLAAALLLASKLSTWMRWRAWADVPGAHAADSAARDWPELALNVAIMTVLIIGGIQIAAHRGAASAMILGYFGTAVIPVGLIGVIGRLRGRAGRYWQLLPVGIVWVTAAIAVDPAAAAGGIIIGMAAAIAAFLFGPTIRAAATVPATP